MPFKFDADGNIVTQEVNGQKLPVFVGADGKENPFDADSTVATISRLNGEAKGHRERAESAEGKLKSFEGITDPAAALKALATMKNLDEKKLVDAGERDQAISNAVKSVEEKYGPLVQELEKVKGELNEHLIGGAFASSKYIAENFAAEGPAAVDLARKLFAGQLRVEDGKVVGYDAQGNKLYSPSRHGELASEEEAIVQIVGGYPHKNYILKGSGANGGGAGHGGGNGGGKKTMSREQFNQVDPAMRAQFLKEGGTLTE